MEKFDRPTFTPEQKELFLGFIADGMDRREAAIKVQELEDDAGRPCYSTATRWKGLTFRDPEFGERYAEALIEAGAEENPLNLRIKTLERGRLLERMLDEAILRGLDPERGKSGASNRLLQNLLTLMHDVWKPFLEARTTRHVHSGAVGIFALPQIDTDKWTLEEHEEFSALEARRTELLEIARPDGAPALASNGRKAQALPTPQDEYAIVEGTAEEIFE